MPVSAKDLRLLRFMGFVAALTASCMGFAQGQGMNIARDCPVTFSSPPNYAAATDTADKTQLTDGVYSMGNFWTQKSTVGWSKANPVLITIDLKKIQPIAGVSFDTAAGRAGVTWPIGLYVLVSDDGSGWRYICNLVSRSAAVGLPPAEGYDVHRFTVGDLQTHGRYLQIAVGSTSDYVFCDEIEVYKGPDALLQREPGGTPVTDVKAFVTDSATQSGILWRVESDAAEARSAVEGSAVSGSVKDELISRIRNAEQDALTITPPQPADFRAILPFSDAHARIFSVYGPLLRARGLPGFFVWKKNRYDRIRPASAPTKATDAVTVSMEMMRNEFRSDAFLVTNATDGPAQVLLRVNNVPGAPRPQWLTISTTAWTDTSALIPVAAALSEAAYADGAFRVTLPAGLTTMVWLTVDSAHLDPGMYRGTIGINGAGTALEVAINVRVSTVTMARPRLALGMWDYTDRKGNYGITLKNMPAAISLMSSHFVDSPWARAPVLPQPSAADFDKNDRLTKSLDFSSFDEWVKRWPDARRYLIFLSTKNRSTMAGKKAGTTGFTARVGEWMRAIANHLPVLGLTPPQLGFLLVDEPNSDAADQSIVEWAKPIKAAVPGFLLFEDPAREQPQLAKNQEAITLMDILCPLLGHLYTGGSAAQAYYRQRRNDGQQLWIYQTSGPTRLFDPYRYDRLAAWEAFRIGAVGIGFWSFGDIGEAVSSWNEYTARRSPRSPVFIGVEDVTTDVHWEAVREGVEDYEYLAMLRDAGERTKDPSLKSQAQRLLTNAPDTVIGPRNADYSWAEEEDRTPADAYRIQALDLLEKMQ
jgi:hypothetical protein